MKPPAFQFYADDFVGGTAILSTEETGAYILLLCHQWTTGSIPDDDKLICRIAKLSLSYDLTMIRTKFFRTPDGVLKNLRMEIERSKQAEFRASRSESGKAGANKRWHSHSTAIAQPMANGMAKDSSPSPSPSPKGEPPAGNLSTSERISKEGELKRAMEELKYLGKVSDHDPGSPKRERITFLKLNIPIIRNQLGVIA